MITSMTEPVGITVRRRRLARELRRYRQEAGLSIEQAATELLCGAGTVHRMEAGKNATPLRVKAALELYGAPPDVVESMIQVAKESRQRGWWQSYGDVIGETFGTYVGLESDASEIRAFWPDIVDGLLQTADYARAVTEMTAVTDTPEAIERLLAVRLERQRQFLSAHAKRLWVVLGEGALRCQVGGPETMAAQLRHLAELAERPNVTIQVAPFRTGAHAALGRGPFRLLSFPDPDYPDVVYTENLASFLVLERAPDVARFRIAMDHLMAESAGPSESLWLVRQVAKEYAIS